MEHLALHGDMSTSPGGGVLEGTTRQTVIELSKTLNIECRITKLPANALRETDEVFITSTAGGIMPVRSIDARPFGDGAPGPVTMRFKDLTIQKDSVARFPIVRFKQGTDEIQSPEVLHTRINRLRRNADRVSDDDVHCLRD